jgi:cold shock CspA family protein/ribosome-associated translation inhibitor RaiA
MKLPVQITFKNMNPSGAVEKWVRAEAEKLDKFYTRIMSCRVAVEVPHHHHKKGNPYHLRIELTVPGEEIVIKRETSVSRRASLAGESAVKKQLEVSAPHKNLQLAIKDAFKAATRRLQDYARCHRGDVKSHVPLQVARVSRIFPGKSYGFLTADDGHEIYFHKNSVLNLGFSRLKTGTWVSFVEEQGEKGPQSSTVRIIRKRNPVPLAKQSAQVGTGIKISS